MCVCFHRKLVVSLLFVPPPFCLSDGINHNSHPQLKSLLGGLKQPILFAVYFPEYFVPFVCSTTVFITIVNLELLYELYKVIFCKVSV